MQKKNAAQPAPDAAPTATKASGSPSTAAQQRKNGRPKGSTKFAIDPGLIERIAANLRLGLSLANAAEIEGVQRDTAYLWKKHGAAGIEPYVEFFHAITRATAEGARYFTLRALKGGPGSHQAMFFLERRYREDYGNVQRLEHTGHDGGAIEVKAIAAMSDEELRKLAAGK